MCGSGHRVVVTSPNHQWLGSELVQPGLLALLVGQAREKGSTSDGDEDVIVRLRRECRELDIVVLFAEQNEGKWAVVPVEKIGTPPYFVSSVLTVNFFNEVRACESNGEQDSYLEDVGIAIDEQFVGI